MATYKVIIEHSAENDLLGILTYITETLKEPIIARKLYIRIKEQILTLDKLPQRHSLIEEEPYCSMGIRKIPVENYLVFYIADDIKKEVQILRILYNRREWLNLI